MFCNSSCPLNLNLRLKEFSEFAPWQKGVLKDDRFYTFCFLSRPITTALEGLKNLAAQGKLVVTAGQAAARPAVCLLMIPGP